MNNGTGQQLSVSTVAAIRIESLGLANDVGQTVPPISDDINCDGLSAQSGDVE